VQVSTTRLVTEIWSPDKHGQVFARVQTVALRTPHRGLCLRLTKRNAIPVRGRETIRTVGLELRRTHTRLEIVVIAEGIYYHHLLTDGIGRFY
jgi:hypothetical protein